MFTTIESNYGHRFVSTDRVGYDTCLVCGAMYELVDRDDRTVRYITALGNDPMECTGDTGMIHGYPGERYCHEHDTLDGEGETCEHVGHECSCLFCN